MFDKLSFISDKYNALTEKVSDPQIIADQSKWQKYAKELSELEPIIHCRKQGTFKRKQL